MIMEIEKFAKEAEKLLISQGLEVSRPADYRVEAVVTADSLLPAAKALVDGNWGYLSAITGLDIPAPEPKEGEKPGENQIEVLYQHFFADGTGKLI